MNARMTTPLPEIAGTYIRATNDHDAAAFIALFADGAVVNDNGHTFRGLAAIKAWSDREIFAAGVTLEVLDVAGRDGETVVTTKVDGNFDRTGLPDPVIINHLITVEGDKIAGLTCRLAGGERAEGRETRAESDPGAAVRSSSVRSREQMPPAESGHFDLRTR